MAIPKDYVVIDLEDIVLAYSPRVVSQTEAVIPELQAFMDEFTVQDIIEHSFVVSARDLGTEQPENYVWNAIENRFQSGIGPIEHSNEALERLDFIMGCIVESVDHELTARLRMNGLEQLSEELAFHAWVTPTVAIFCSDRHG